MYTLPFGGGKIFKNVFEKIIMLTEYIWKKKKKAKLNLKVKLWHFKIFKNFISL